MNTFYLFALANFALCSAIAVISLCRLNAMQCTVLFRVRSEYAAYMGCATASGLQPLWGEWPMWGSLAMAGALLLGLLCSAHAWRSDRAPDIATAPAPLEGEGS